MNKETKKYFCGSGKFIANGKGMKANICLDRIPAEFITTNKKGERWVKLVQWIKDAPDQYGNDASIEVDTWKPESKDEAQRVDEKGLPF
jgi:hypothetical protein